MSPPNQWVCQQCTTFLLRNAAPCFACSVFGSWSNPSCTGKHHAATLLLSFGWRMMSSRRSWGGCRNSRIRSCWGSCCRQKLGSRWILRNSRAKDVGSCPWAWSRFQKLVLSQNCFWSWILGFLPVTCRIFGWACLCKHQRYNRFHHYKLFLCLYHWWCLHLCCILKILNNLMFHFQTLSLK